MHTSILTVLTLESVQGGMTPGRDTKMPGVYILESVIKLLKYKRSTTCKMGAPIPRVNNEERASNAP